MQWAQQNIWIGTSNITVPGNKDSFPVPYNLRSRLHYYSFLFDSLEVNQTFYKIPRPATYERWAGEVTEPFQFTLKLSKEITHCKNLKGNLDLIEQFFYAAERLQGKKGCILFQFPGKVTLDYFNEVEAILEKAASATDSINWKKALEFRDKSWHVGETYELLNSFNATMVMHDMPKSKIMDVHTNAAFAYLRFHGPVGDYRGSYTNEFLEEKAEQVTRLACGGKDVYVYFNNTIGNAFYNACTLIEMIRKQCC